MAKKKKPTMKEVTQVVGQVINQVEILRKRHLNMEVILSHYISYSKDDKGFKKYMDKKAKEFDENRAKDSVHNEKRQDISKSK